MVNKTLTIQTELGLTDKQPLISNYIMCREKRDRIIKAMVTKMLTIQTKK